jgi:hypothetical protein
MFTLISTALSFLMGGLPKLLDFFQDKSDKKHELALAAMQMERELKLMEAGYAAQARVEEIRTEQVQMETQAQERTAMYAHDIEIGKGASQWIINLRASVRPVVTYLFVLLLIIVDVASIWWHGLAVLLLPRLFQWSLMRMRCRFWLPS